MTTPISTEYEGKLSAGLARLTRVINTESEPEPIYEAILREAQSLVACEQAHLYIYGYGLNGQAHPSFLATLVPAESTTSAPSVRVEVLSAKRAACLMAEEELLSRAVALSEPVTGLVKGSQEKTLGVFPLEARGRLQGLLALRYTRCLVGDEITVGARLGELAATALALLASQRHQQEGEVRFLSRLAHELRSPLNAINGYLDLSLSGVGGELSEQQREFMQRARVGSEYLYALLEDLLLLGRANTGQLQFRKQVTHLSELVTNALEDLELTLEDAEIQVSTQLADLPPIYADPIRLQQVLRNFFSYLVAQARSQDQLLLLASVEAESETPIEEDRQEENGRWLHLELEGPLGDHQEAQESEKGVFASETLRALAIARLIIEQHGGVLTQEERAGGRCVLLARLPIVLS
jgi:K+-sensing histidine kinase KdpD